MPDLNFGPAGVDIGNEGQLAQVNSGSLMQSIATFGAGTPLGGGLGVGGMNAGAIGSGVSDLFQAAGDAAEAKNYASAATLATQNDEFTIQSTKVQQSQAARSIFSTIGAQKTGVAGSGFTESGSALSLLQNSASQGALTHQMIGQQGLITEAGYAEQAKAYTTMKEAANTAETGSVIGGVFNIAAGILGL
jgi:hypothetical protein